MQLYFGKQKYKNLESKKIYLIRHGQTDYNKNGVVQGSGIDAGLNDTGRKQAGAFYDMYREVKFEKIYISGLKRTQESVQKFIGDGIPFEKLNGLNEISWGVAEGQVFTVESNNHYMDLVEKWRNGETNVRVEGGESPDDVERRQRKAFEHILAQTDERVILICMHGRAMRILLCWLLGEPIYSMDNYQHDNLGLYIVNFVNNKFSIESYNNIDHLVDV